jgi:hypothetical protein
VNNPKNETRDGETEFDRRAGNEGSCEATGPLAGTAFVKNRYAKLQLAIDYTCYDR